MDIVPTLLEITGLEMPAFNHGIEQYPMSGVSMAYTFDAEPDAPTQKKIQYYEMFGTRGIWKDGWASAGAQGASAGASAGPATGARAETAYHKGMAVFVHARGGLMYEAAIGGQKFNFEPLEE